MTSPFQVDVHNETTLLVKDLGVRKRIEASFEADVTGDKVMLPPPFDKKPIKFGATCFDGHIWFFIRRESSDYLKVGTFTITMVNGLRTFPVALSTPLPAGDEFIGGRAFMSLDDVQEWLHDDGSIHYLVEFLNGIKFQSKPTDVYYGQKPQDLIAASFDTGVGADIELDVNGKTLMTSKFILAVNSNVFKEMFEKKSGDDHGAGDKAVQINDVDFNVLLELVKSMYGVEAVIEDMSFALKLIVAADKYDVGYTKYKAIGFAKDNIRNENVLEVLSLSHKLDIEELKKAALAYLHPISIQELTDLKGYGNLDSEVKDLLIADLFARLRAIC